MLMFAIICVIAVATAFVLCYAACAASADAERRSNEMKRIMCENAQKMCDRDCDHCAWKVREW